MPIVINHQGFGGTSTGTSFNGGNIFITTSGAGIYFGTATIDGTWLIVTSGNNLSFQRRESGTYVEKSADTP